MDDLFIFPNSPIPFNKVQGPNISLFTFLCLFGHWKMKFGMNGSAEFMWNARELLGPICAIPSILWPFFALFQRSQRTTKIGLIKFWNLEGTYSLEIVHIFALKLSHKVNFCVPFFYPPISLISLTSIFALILANFLRLFISFFRHFRRFLPSTFLPSFFPFTKFIGLHRP
jgi:hypothetical protein